MDLKQFQIENDEIILSILQESDAQDLYEAVKNTLVDLRKFPASLPWAIEEPELESSKTFCRSRLQALLNKENFVFTIRLKENNALLCIMDIHKIDWQNNCAEIGFWGNSRYKKQGYMTHALNIFVNTLLSRWSFKTLKAYTDVENISARKLCERAYFVLQNIEYGALKNPIDGSLRDHCIYQIENK